MLVIEGSDCLGKTILAKKIVDKMMERGYPTIYSHMSRPNEQIFDFFWDYKKMINPCAVMDRFMLGGLAYHHDKISKQQLLIINAWIRSVGGMIVVLYAANEEWYRKRLENDERGNMLTIDKMCAGNNFFKKFSTKGGMDSDYAFNILPELCYDEHNGKPRYVDDYDVDELIEEWIERRQALGI